MEEHAGFAVHATDEAEAVLHTANDALERTWESNQSYSIFCLTECFRFDYFFHISKEHYIFYESSACPYFREQTAFSKMIFNLNCLPMI